MKKIPIGWLIAGSVVVVGGIAVAIYEKNKTSTGATLPPKKVTPPSSISLVRPPPPPPANYTAVNKNGIPAPTGGGSAASPTSGPAPSGSQITNALNTANGLYQTGSNLYDQYNNSGSSDTSSSDYSTGDTSGSGY